MIKQENGRRRKMDLISAFMGAGIILVVEFILSIVILILASKEAPTIRDESDIILENYRKQIDKLRKQVEGLKAENRELLSTYIVDEDYKIIGNGGDFDLDKN
jgi:uncharacterized membrane-anchored protein YhcB (DUF1043 family)